MTIPDLIKRDMPKDLRFISDSIMWLERDIGSWGILNDCGPIEDLRRNIDAWLKNVNNKRVCVQAGGNHGLYPLCYSYYFENVITFEPAPVLKHTLNKNCDKQNIEIYYVGLSNENKKTKITNIHPSNLGMHTISNDGDVEVDVIKLDSLNLPVLDLLHLDIEGHEIYALEGASETIDRCKPVIIIEANNYDKYLKERGYQLYGQYHDYIWVYNG